MNKVDGGFLVAQALRREGVSHVFTLVGGHVMPILYACRDAGIKIIDVRHEATAVYAADAYARVTGRPGVAVTTAGPGVLHTVAAMAEARDTGVPLIHIGGASPLVESDTGPLQEGNTLEVMAAVSSWARRVHQVHRIPEYLSMAFREAGSVSPGPAYLEIPVDVLLGETVQENVLFPRAYRTEALSWGNPGLIEEAAKLISTAERPAIIVGNQARFSSSNGAALAELSDYIKAPVLAQTLVRGLFADEETHPCFSLGMALPLLAKADLVLMLGVKNDYLIFKGRAPVFNPEARLIQVNPDPTRVGFNCPADLGIVGGVEAVSGQLLDELRRTVPARTDHRWLEEAANEAMTLGAGFMNGFLSDELPMNPGWLAFEVSRFLSEQGRDWTLVIDGGDAAMWMGTAAKAHRPGQILTYGPSGTLGVGPGFALGAWVANGQPVLYFTGDGSFGLYPMEFDTFRKHGVPVVAVISNDSSWGLIKLAENLIHPEQAAKGGCGLEDCQVTAYEKMAAMWGGCGELVVTPAEVGPALKRAAKTRLPAIINAEVSREAMSPIIQVFCDYFGAA